MNPNHDEHDNGMMAMMAAMMAICLGVLTLVILPAVALPGALGIAIALGAVMLIGHRLFMHPGGHRH